ncbi:MAG: hypothetical protein ACO25B_11430 [Chitinophagaceae bacterium]
MPESISGEYHLTNVREMASGFLLHPDGRFEFYFSYGALDRFGKGNWELRGNAILFNSVANPGPGFRLVSSRKNSEKLTLVRVESQNRMLLQFMYCSLAKGEGDSWFPMSREGEIEYPPHPIESISLRFEFCPDQDLHYSVPDNEHNEFVFHPEPWLGEVFLENFELEIIPDGLRGKHPLMQGDSFSYGKTPES